MSCPEPPPPDLTDRITPLMVEWTAAIGSAGAIPIVLVGTDSSGDVRYVANEKAPPELLAQTLEQVARSIRQRGALKN